MNSYGTLSEVVYSPSFIGTSEEPLTLPTVKEFLGIPELSPADTAKDSELELLIAAAREIAEEEWGGDIKLKQYLLVFDGWPCEEIRLRFPFNSVDLFRYRDEDGDWTNLVLGTGYIIDSRKNPPIVTLPDGGSWPTATLWPTSAVEIYFSSGFADEDAIPKKLKQGMLLLISHWFNQKLPVANVAGQPQEIPWTVSRLLRGSPRP